VKCGAGDGRRKISWTESVKNKEILHKKESRKTGI